MTQKELIRQEIERRLKYTHDWLRGDEKRHPKQAAISKNYYKMKGDERTLDALLSFIDSLPDENNPEPYNPVYDEDYLNEKIAKATKSWEGVDVNKMLADCRGYEEKPSEELKDAAVKWEPKYGIQVSELIIHDIRDAFIAGAEWQKSQMTKDVEEGEIGYWNQTGLSIRLDQSLEKLGYDEDTRVEVIIKKKD